MMPQKNQQVSLNRYWVIPDLLISGFLDDESKFQLKWMQINGSKPYVLKTEKETNQMDSIFGVGMESWLVSSSQSSFQTAAMTRPLRASSGYASVRRAWISSLTSATHHLEHRRDRLPTSPARQKYELHKQLLLLSEIKHHTNKLNIAFLI